jgi:hypothetical protein
MGNPSQWKGTKLHVNQGTIKNGNVHVPGNIAGFLNDSANASAKTLASLSPNQNEKIKEFITSNPDKIIKSEVLKAIQYDILHSGNNAFTIT